MHVRIGSELNLLLFFAIMDTHPVKKGLTEQRGHRDISNSVALCKILLFSEVQHLLQNRLMPANRRDREFKDFTFVLQPKLWVYYPKSHDVIAASSAQAVISYELILQIDTNEMASGKPAACIKNTRSVSETKLQEWHHCSGYPPQCHPPGRGSEHWSLASILTAAAAFDWTPFITRQIEKSLFLFLFRSSYQVK